MTDREDWKQWFASQFQLVQWTMASVPQHPILHRTMANIVKWFEEKKHLDNKSIIKSTGPGIWSESIKQHLLEKHGVVMGTAPFTHAALKMQGLHAGSVVLLPKRGLGSHPGVSGDDIYVSHGFQGTWKKGYVDWEATRVDKDKAVAGAAADTAATAEGGDTAAATAQATPPILAVGASCDADRKALCADVLPGGGRTHMCLVAQHKKVRCCQPPPGTRAVSLVRSCAPSVCAPRLCQRPRTNMSTYL